jgi:O-antigen/teichoic acid export membrane protein
MARLLGPAARGQVSLCMMAVWCGATLGGLGADIPIVHFAAARKNPSNWLRPVLLWGAAGSAAACMLWWLLYTWFRASAMQGVTSDLALVVLLSIPLAVLFNESIAFLTGAEVFRERAAVALLENLLSLLAMLAFFRYLGRTSLSAMWGNWCGLAAGILFTVFLARRILRDANWASSLLQNEIRQKLWMGLQGQLGNVAAIFTYRLDVFIVNYFLNPAQVGIYAVGVVVSESLWQIPQAVAAALFPRTARTMEHGSQEFTCLIIRHVLLISVVSGALVALVSPFAIPLLFGGRFAGSVQAIWWLLPGTIGLSVGKVAASDLAGRGKTLYSSIFSLISLIVTVALDFTLIPRMGIQGAALASSVAYLTNSVLLASAVHHELKVRWTALLIPSREELASYREVGGRLFSQRSPSQL